MPVPRRAEGGVLCVKVRVRVRVHVLPRAEGGWEWCVVTNRKAILSDH
jgi:hypothetical protein